MVCVRLLTNDQAPRATLFEMDEAIGDVLAADPRIAYALVFGSQAIGRQTPFSDLDVAIGLKAGARLDTRALGALIADLER